MEDNIIYLEDEQGEEIAFEFIDIFPYNEEEYAVLLPVDEEDNEAVIFKVVPDDEYDNYIAVEDEAVLEAVFELFKNKFKDEFDFSE